MKDDIKCKECGGAKEIVKMLDEPYFTKHFNIYKDRERVDCPHCKGTGKEPEDNQDEIRKAIINNLNIEHVEESKVFASKIDSVVDRSWATGFYVGYKSRDKQIEKMKCCGNCQLKHQPERSEWCLNYLYKHNTCDNWQMKGE